MAAQTVLGTYELLEQIIAYLPPPNINKVRHVSRRWVEVIKDSKRIRQLRFLAPVMEVYLPRRSKHWGPVPSYSVPYPITLNTGTWRWYERDDVVSIVIEDELDDDPRLSSKMEKQFLTNPPCQAVEIRLEHVHVESGRPDLHRRTHFRTTYNEYGVRLGDVMNAYNDLLVLNASDVYSRGFYSTVVVEIMVNQTNWHTFDRHPVRNEYSLLGWI